MGWQDSTSKGRLLTWQPKTDHWEPEMKGAKQETNEVALLRLHAGCVMDVTTPMQIKPQVLSHNCHSSNWVWRTGGSVTQGWPGHISSQSPIPYKKIKMQREYTSKSLSQNTREKAVTLHTFLHRNAELF